MKSFIFSAWLGLSVSLFALSEKEAEEIAIDAYIYAYPLVTIDLTREVLTNTEKPTLVPVPRAPLGQLSSLREYPTADFHDVTAPNADTLYTFGFVDVSKEPYVLHIPAMKDNRYYLFPLLSAWSDVFASPGTRTIGNKGADVVITGPHWDGVLPSGLTQYKSPTGLVWIIGRTYSSGTPDDLAAVHKIQDEYSLKPLSAFNKPYTLPEGKINPNIDSKTPVRDQVNNLSGEAYFTRFSSLLKNNPPLSEDKAIIDKLAKIGIVPGKPFDFNTLDPQIKNALSLAPKKGIERIIGHEKDSGKTVNGWRSNSPIGKYGTDYLQRAYIAFFGLGANLPEDAIYPNTSRDNNGAPLTGNNHYVIHFKKGELPPVKGFWSLTLYNDQFFFYKNPLNRYTLSQRDPLKYNEDGSLDLYVQHDTPGKDKETNWLPAPEGKFNLLFRFYWPEESIINGQWALPPVKIVK